MTKQIKLDELFLAIGYSVSAWKSSATMQLQKIGFTKEQAQGTHLLTEEKTIELLARISDSGSKYKKNASDLLKDGFETLETEDENYVCVNLSKTAKAVAPSVKKDHITFDLKEFIETISTLEEFEKFRANKYTV